VCVCVCGAHISQQNVTLSNSMKKALVGKLAGPRSVKRFPTFHGTRSFMATFKTATSPNPEPD
jgi:hypothetical protein